MLPLLSKKSLVLFFVVLFPALFVTPVWAMAGNKSKPVKKEHCTTLVVVLQNALDGPGSDHKGTLNRLTSKLASATGHDVQGLETISRSKGYATALALKAHLLLELSPASSEEGGYAGVVLKEVPTEKMLGDTSVSTAKPDALVTAISVWYKEVVDRGVSCTPYDVSKVLTRLKTEERCDDILEALSRKEVASEMNEEAANSLTQLCENQKKETEDRRTVPSSMALGMRFEGVPISMQQKCYEAVEATGLDRRATEMSNSVSQLLVACDTTCSSGTFRLQLPFDETWFRAHLQKDKNPLAPYHSVASALIKTKAKAPSPISSFATELLLMDPSGATLRIAVEGTASNPRLKPMTPAKDFFPETN